MRFPFRISTVCHQMSKQPWERKWFSHCQFFVCTRFLLLISGIFLIIATATWSVWFRQVALVTVMQVTRCKTKFLLVSCDLRKRSHIFTSCSWPVWPLSQKQKAMVSYSVLFTSKWIEKLKKLKHVASPHELAAMLRVYPHSTHSILLTQEGPVRFVWDKTCPLQLSQFGKNHNKVSPFKCEFFF